ncbi:YtpR family tRNA-binding protein [Lentilactobacillus sp. Marseille-Q4993]|uniref:YtpR family tRNA-binding protein n=1 Tax=Lentilactobacillus sp. Marseille-Q4993 TaxID=3039492 RepID=UPI0024BC699C|nr:DUF4479 and tRNA-binding domain-containing protein [Lentilactobacillus sp. Marseille-Q4993]
MLIASYNPKGTGDTLVVILGQDVDDQSTEVHDGVARIFDDKTGNTLGYNFLKASSLINRLKSENGQVFLTSHEVATLNDYLAANGFPADLSVDDTPKFVIGYVEKMEDHPNSDHLKVTTTKVDDGNKLQIVSGSPNMQADIKVVVAKIGAMMPDGLIIWPGALRGVESDGMIVSGRELHLKNAPQKKGALILPDDFGEVGEPFDFEKGQHIFD